MNEQCTKCGCPLTAKNVSPQNNAENICTECEDNKRAAAEYLCEDER